MLPESESNWLLRLKRMMNRWFKEPLLLFVSIGLATAIVFIIVNRQQGEIESKNPIVVSKEKIEQLSKRFQQTWQRPPTPQELRGIVDDYVLEEVYYRHAIKMGIDREDMVIRRHLRKKIEFLTDDLASLRTPGDAQLQKFLDDNIDKFRFPRRFTFRQAYFNPETYDDPSIELERKRLQSEPTKPADPGLLPPRFDAADANEIDRTFGIGFASQLVQIKAGQWQGPLKSGLGKHLVFVEKRIPGQVPKLDEIRNTVEREWRNQQLRKARQAMNDELRSKYEIVVEWPVTNGQSAVEDRK